MKQSILSLFLALVLVLGGCAKPPVPSTGAPTVPESTVPTATAAPTPENRELSVILETDGTISTLSGADDLLAVMLMDGKDDANLVTLDPATGRELGRAVVSTPYVDMTVFSGGVATFSWNSNTLEVYSSAMEPLWTRVLSDGTFGNLQSDDSFYLFPDSESVVRIALADQSEQEISIPAGLVPLDVSLCQDGRSLLRCSDEADSSFRFLWLDWSAGTAEPAELPTPDIFLSRDRYFEAIPGRDALWLHSPILPHFYRLESAQSWVIQSNADRLLCEADGNVLSVYDLKQGTVVRHTTTGVSNATLCGNLVAYREIEQSDKVFLWNPALSQAEPDAVQIWTPEQVRAETERMAAAITARTAMPVFWGESGIEYNHGSGTGYVSDPVTDPLSVYLGMEQLQQLVLEYPEGMFQEMCTDTFQPIEVYLSGAIHGDQYGFDPIGFTTYTDEAQVVVLDIGNIYDPDSLRSTIAHEFMHVMENRIDQHGWDTGIDYLTYWMSYVPEPDLYFFNYFDYQDPDLNPSDYTAGSGLPMEEVLFLDSYSRTMPTEDRARVLEYLYAGEDSTYKDYLQTGILKQKAEYLCAVIRECFPSCRIEG